MKNVKYGFLCFIPSILLLLFWDFLPNKIATHFNFYGNADSFSNKWYIALFVPLLGFIGHILYMFLLEKKPNWIGRNGANKYSFLYIPILTCVTVVVMLWNS